MVIDSSVLIAILEQEREAGDFSVAIAETETRLVSANSAVEVGVVIMSRHGEAGRVKVEQLIQAAGLEIVPVTEAHARLAWEGFDRFGKGRHPAGLNFGDCFTYALAKATGLPLLFKGNDFSLTDLKFAAPTGQR